MNWLAESALAAVVGVVSALLPLVNAEAYALIAAARTRTAGAVIVVLALAAGRRSASWCSSRPPAAGRAGCTHGSRGEPGVAPPAGGPACAA